MRASRDAPATLTPLVAEKLAAFDHLEPEFEECFPYIQAVQGTDRFASFPVAATVRYLHALWICECKDRLLSVPNALKRYRGARGLALLRRWQQTGETADMVGFLSDKLDSLDVVQMSRQLEAARQSDGESVLARRLMHGRMLVVNRGMNLFHALDPLFTLPESLLRVEVEAASARYGHTSGQIEEQLQQLEAPLYAFVRHPALAQRNMILMNRLGNVEIALVEANDQPSSHIWRPVEPSTLHGPSAEQTIEGYVPLRAPWHNNPGGVRWVDRFESLAAPATKHPLGDADVD